MHEYEAHIFNYIHSTNEFKKAKSEESAKRILEKYLWVIEFISTYKNNGNIVSQLKWEELAEQYILREIDIKMKVKSLHYWKSHIMQITEIIINEISNNNKNNINERLKSQKVSEILND